MTASLLKSVAVVWIACFALIAWSGTAKAASPAGEPSVALVDGADPRHDSIVETLRRMLADQDDLEVVSEDELLAAGESRGVDTETLRKGSNREARVDAIRETMREAGVGIILVVDVFAGKAQVVSIGPEGRERSDVRRPLSRGALPDGTAVALLEEAFDDVIPLWKSWKENRSGDASSRSQSASDEEPAETSSAASSEPSGAGAESEPAEPARESSGTDDRSESAIDPGVEVRLGAVAGRHQLNVSTPPASAYGLEQANPFIGGTAELNAVLGRFAERSAGIGLELFGTFAPFRTALRERGGGAGSTVEYESSISQAGIDVIYLKQLSGRFQLRVGTGFEALSLRVEKNAAYTGDRYAQFRFTGGIAYRPSEIFRLRIGGGVAPVVESDMSGGAFGDSAFAPGVLGDARIEMRLFGPTSLSVGYRLYYYDLVFRSPRIIGTRADVSDRYNMLSLKVSYRF